MKVQSVSVTEHRISTFKSHNDTIFRNARLYGCLCQVFLASMHGGPAWFTDNTKVVGIVHFGR